MSIILISRKLFLGAALGSLVMAGLTANGAKASWPAPRCAAQCKAGLFVGRKIGDVAGRVAPSKVKDKASIAYEKVINDCAANCDNIKIKDVLFSGYASLTPANLKNFRDALGSENNKKQANLENIQSQIAAEQAKAKPSSSKIKDLQKKQAKLDSEIAGLKSQMAQLQQSLPKVELEKEALQKIAHPEGQEFIEPTIPQIEGFLDDKATTTLTKDPEGKDRVTLTKWGIVRILQAAGVIVKRDPQETRMVEVPDIKDKTKMTKVIQPLGKEDMDKIIANNPAPRHAGLYSEVVYFINVNPHYLAAGHTQTHYVLKKNRWAPGLERIGGKKRTQNTPAKELVDLKKVRAYIVPKLSKAKYAKIAAIGESAFYLADKEKQYFVVLDAADGAELANLFDDYARKDKAKWHEIMLNVGQAVGELHGLLCDPESAKIPLKDLKLSDIKTIPHGDMHMGNIFYNDKTQSVTFIDTGSMADSLKSKKSPIIDLIQIFGTTKYFHRIYDYDFDEINGDFAPFIEGYAKGFTENKDRQEKIKELVRGYFKDLSNGFGESVSLKASNNPPPNAPVVSNDPYSSSLVDSYIGNYLSIYVHSGGWQGGKNFWWLVKKVFLDGYVSLSIKQQLAPILVHHQMISPQEANAALAKPAGKP